MANYTLNQGETFRVTLELQDSSCNPIRLATVDEGGTVFTPSVFFYGVAILGSETVIMQFQMQAAETLTYGRGAANGRVTETGVFKLYAFIAADDTAVMAAGDWKYEIRQSAVPNPADDTIDSVSTVLEGTITVKDGPLDTGIEFTYSTPASPS